MRIHKNGMSRNVHNKMLRYVCETDHRGSERTVDVPSGRSTVTQRCVLLMIPPNKDMELRPVYTSKRTDYGTKNESVKLSNLS